MDALTQRQQLRREILVAAAARKKVLQVAANDSIMLTDTTGMDPDTKSYIETRKRHIFAELLALDAQMELDRKAATVAAAAAARAEAAVRQLISSEGDGGDKKEDLCHTGGYVSGGEECDL